MEKFDFDALLERPKPLSKVQNIGTLTIYQDRIKPIFDCVTMELGWNDNKRRISCIPAGLYKVVRRYSSKYGWHFHILGVTGRDLILIHEANYSRQLLGCVGVGERVADIDKDGLKDITNSKSTKKKLLSICPEEFWLRVV